MVLASCTNRADPQAVAAAHSLVPDGSPIVSSHENTDGLAFESGEYFARLEITDGGRGPALADAIAARADVAGWTMVERAPSADTEEVTFTQESYEATVYVWLDRTPVSATIFVRKADSP
jgi:hypothetical protein